jgi:hypothetical protein
MPVERFAHRRTTVLAGRLEQISASGSGADVPAAARLVDGVAPLGYSDHGGRHPFRYLCGSSQLRSKGLRWDERVPISNLSQCVREEHMVSASADFDAVTVSKVSLAFRGRIVQGASRGASRQTHVHQPQPSCDADIARPISSTREGLNKELADRMPVIVIQPMTVWQRPVRWVGVMPAGSVSLGCQTRQITPQHTAIGVGGP